MPSIFLSLKVTWVKEFFESVVASFIPSERRRRDSVKCYGRQTTETPTKEGRRGKGTKGFISATFNGLQIQNRPYTVNIR